MNRRSVLKSIAAACTASAATVAAEETQQSACDAADPSVVSADVVYAPACGAATKTVLVLQVKDKNASNEVILRLGRYLQSFVYENGLNVIPVVIPGHSSLSLMTVPAVPADVAAMRAALCQIERTTKETIRAI